MAMVIVCAVAILFGVLLLVAASVALAAIAAKVVLRYQHQVSFPLELMLRQSARDGYDYAARASGDAAAAGRAKENPATGAPDEPEPEGPTVIPTSQAALQGLLDRMPGPGE